MKLSAVSSTSFATDSRYYRLSDSGWKRCSVEEKWDIWIVLIPAHLSMEDHFGFAVYGHSKRKVTTLKEIPPSLRMGLLKEAENFKLNQQECTNNNQTVEQ
jgi:hypothetical protein